ncbi:S9 family peptidase [Sphingomonas yabuuchiae]|uniref:Dipeptidyl aminopeptidase/acylaminoacyl peptidase n=1 Tax=Sphingomonas yabuuchiae TaxID=172044 RepID=A0AA40ZW23_9SPHN|nr:prolyl oligopeptidase family serine peptidase [Sphingomonas yabuuchiae]MBB4610723.1 dipeptidyl aminopeptidase/acylaminoacyl peptidase [Sphingomonas yabuuchiae]MBN3557211.1 S9 family peptidase [Sphingomonas yabuuchiae]
MIRLLCLAITISSGLLGIVPAQSPDDTASRLDRAARIEAWPQAIRDSMVAPRWLQHGERLVFWDAIGPMAGTWVIVDAARQKRRPIITPVRLREQLAALTGQNAALPEQMPFVLTPDERGLVFDYAGNGFRLDFAKPDVRRIEKSRMDARLLAGGIISPGRDRIVLQQGEGFAVFDAAGRTVIERTGTSDLAWELPEQPWSPDGRLAVWLIDSRMVHHIPVVDYTAASEQVAMVPYPKVGTPIASARLHLFDPASGELREVSNGQDEGYDWLADWRSDGSALVLHLARDGKRLDLLSIGRDGQVRRLLREERRDTKVADLNFAVGGWRAQVVPLAAGHGFLWISERDGWRHVYHYDDAGRLIRQVTRGTFPVVRVDGVSDDGTLLVTGADPAAPYDERLYRGNLKGDALRPVSVDPGVHMALISPSGRYLVDSHSSWTSSRRRDLIRSDGSGRMSLTIADASAVAATGYAPPEPIRVLAADGVTPLHGALYHPFGFDPTRRYPVVAYIYGGPLGTVLSRTYTGNTMMRRAEALAAAGFVVVAIDVRGSAGRSKAFSDATYGKIGQNEISDYVTGLHQLAKTRPWMDLTRVGIHGHSWGGYFAIRAMLVAPDFFKAGYAGAPGALDEDALVNEPDMGRIADNPGGYAAGSNLALAEHLSGPLRIMHGTADVNAPLSSSMRMVDALIRANKPVEQLVMPGVAHDPEGPAGAYYRDDVIRFFVRTLAFPSTDGAYKPT